MKVPGKPKLHYPEISRNIPVARPYTPEDMDKSMKNSEGALDENYGKSSLPSYNRAKMPQMKP